MKRSMNRMCVSVSASLLCQSVLHGQPQVAAPMGFQPAQTLSVGLARPTASSIPVPRPDEGKPFSATVTTQTTQVLGDGTRIVRTTTMLEYRDAEGRVRTETTQGNGQPAEGARIVIRDPVAKVVWRLDPVQKSAVKSAEMPVLVSVLQEKLRQFGGTVNAIGLGRGETEDLGTSTVNGVLARGTRITNTVPAGAIGNDREFHSVEERWFSSELNLLIKSVNTDPRFGTTTYELTNISRQAPDHSLFQIPPGYKLSNGDLVEAIEFSGLSHVSQDSLRSILSIRVGDEYDAEAVRKDLAALRNTGRFSDVKANQVRGGHGGVVLRFALTERQ